MRTNREFPYYDETKFFYKVNLWITSIAHSYLLDKVISTYGFHFIS
ncbi:hypothetical protein RIEPE_0469 [Candidatus Riesia pediculicola USDA]|uniref:Uncharacterized protein n=1 Tax=Riesia pediculicola (strain USDA) TaxID=515618 RepID=D4G8Q1_RIEPU|nr:hypothetical protein RIEPE_0469 [Candidatus Riesia pediculicola USDA]